MFCRMITLKKSFLFELIYIQDLKQLVTNNICLSLKSNGMLNLFFYFSNKPNITKF